MSSKTPKQYVWGEAQSDSIAGEVFGLHAAGLDLICHLMWSPELNDRTWSLSEEYL